MRHSLPYKSVFFLLVFLFCTPFVYAQHGGGRMAGGIINVQVRFRDGRPAPPGIHIRLESAVGGSEADAETVQGGKCQFNQKTSGVFVVRLTATGYKEVSARVELIGDPMAYVVLDLIPI